MENTVAKEIYSEVYAILKMLGKEYINKLPGNIYKIIEEEKSTEYNPVYATTVALDRQNIKKETISIIAFLHLNYWCNEEEKIRLRELFDENEDKYQEELEQQEIDLENEEVQEDNEIEIGKEFLSMVIYKEENFVQKFFNKIKKLFSRKKEMFE